MYSKVFVVGVGMTDFTKPNSLKDYTEIGKEAVEKALIDSGVSYDVVQQAVCGYTYGNSSCGQRVLCQVGVTGIPIHNVNNHGATGATALFLAHQLIQGSTADVILALGFEKMSPGALPTPIFSDRAYPFDKHLKKMLEMAPVVNVPLPIQCFGYAAMEHMEKYGTKETHFTKIAAKNHENATRNPHALNNTKYTLNQIMTSKRMFGPITKLQCCANCDGAAAALLMSEKAVEYYKLHSKAVEIVGMAMATDTAAVFTENSRLKIAGYDMTALAAKQVYEKTGISPSQVHVVELHDCFASNELITYEGLQLCDVGKGGHFVDAGDNTYGGKVVVNPSGGLIGRGNPIGATGLAQCAELVWQLRGEAGKRQVQNARIGLQHNLGLGGAVVVAIYRKAFDGSQLTNAVGDPKKFVAYKYLKIIEEAIRNNEIKITREIRGVYGVRVRNGPGASEGYWVINLKDGNGKITYNGNEKTDVTFIVNDRDVPDIIKRKLNPNKVFFRGQIKVEGDMALALKLREFALTKINLFRSKI